MYPCRMTGRPSQTGSGRLSLVARSAPGRTQRDRYRSWRLQPRFPPGDLDARHTAGNHDQEQRDAGRLSGLDRQQPQHPSSSRQSGAPSPPATRRPRPESWAPPAPLPPWRGSIDTSPSLKKQSGLRIVRSPCDDPRILSCKRRSRCQRYDSQIHIAGCLMFKLI